MSERTCPNCGHSIGDEDRFCSSCGAPAEGRRLPLAASSDELLRRSLAGASSGASQYLGALRRFWWVVVLGAGIALFVALSALYSVSLFPPELTSKERITYSAGSRLLVTSQEDAHLRYQFSFFAPQDDDAAERPDGAPLLPIGSTPPDINTIVRAANLFPILIESDRVAAYRDKEFGPLEGSVAASGIYSFTTANRFELSEIPVIQLNAVADSADGAIELADKTAKAFIGWIVAEQNADDVPPQDRIVVKQLNVPSAAIPSPGSSRTMPVLVFFVVFGAFCLLVVLLDRIVPPRRRPGPAEVEPIEAAKVKKTA